MKMDEPNLITNALVEGEVKEKGHALLQAAYEFWLAHAKAYGHHACVWLDSEDGKFVLFTRGEYKSQIMRNVFEIPFGNEMRDHPLEWEPVEVITQEEVDAAVATERHRVVEMVTSNITYYQSHPMAPPELNRTLIAEMAFLRDKIIG